MKRWLALLVIVVGCGKPAETPPPPSAPEIPVAEQYGASAITGRVLFKGEAPRPGTIKMTADPYCQTAHGGTVSSQEVVVNTNGTLRHVFVYVKQGLTGRYPPPKQPAVLDQHGCLYQPRVQGIQTGQPLLIRNSDDTLHNVQCLAEKNPPFNIGQPTRGFESRKVFQQPEVMIRFKCDVHSWMTAWLGVLDHPFFAVTGDDGAFALERLPAGQYLVEAWHEKYGARQQTVTVAAGETRMIEFEFSP